MDIGGTFGKVWKKAATIAVAWGVVSGVISLVTGIADPTGVLALGAAGILGLVGFAVSIAVGYFGAEQSAGGVKSEMGSAAVAGILAGIVYGIVATIVGLCFSAISMVVGIGAYAAGGMAEAGLAGGIGIIGLIIAAVVGIPLAAIFGAIFGVIGGIIYAVIKK